MTKSRLQLGGKNFQLSNFQDMCEEMVTKKKKSLITMFHEVTQGSRRVSRKKVSSVQFAKQNAIKKSHFGGRDNKHSCFLAAAEPIKQSFGRRQAGEELLTVQQPWRRR